MPPSQRLVEGEIHLEGLVHRAVGDLGHRAAERLEVVGLRLIDEDVAVCEKQDSLRHCSRRAPTGIRNGALLAGLFRSGLRVSEALALLPKDLDPAGHSIRVLHGKGDKARTAPLPTDAADAVDRLLECRKRLGLTGRYPLFCTLRGEPLWDS
jgi:site-specific recombinase XerD